MEITEIKNPRRILALGAPESGVLTLLKDLTGSSPALVTDTTAGLTHSYTLKTRYYTATVPIWIDEIPSVADWHSEFIKPEAKEVISVLGAWIFCFRKPVSTSDIERIKETLKAVSEVIKGASGGYGEYGEDAVCLAVAMPQSITTNADVGKSSEEWEELCQEYGFEYVDSEAKGKNEFGEEMGVKRVEDALKANDWDGADDAELDFGLGDNGEFAESFEAEEEEIGMELFGLKAAVNGAENEDGEGDGEKQVEELESMMRRIVAIKDTGEGMSEAERKRFAAKAVNDLLKDF